MSKEADLFELPFGKFGKAIEPLTLVELKALFDRGSKSGQKKCHLGRLREQIDDFDDSDSSGDESAKSGGGGDQRRCMVDYQKQLEEKLQESDCVRKSSREDDTLYVLNIDYAKKAESGEQSELERDFVEFLFSPSQTSPAENLALACLQLRRRLGAKGLGLTQMQMWRCVDRVIESGGSEESSELFDKLISNWFHAAEATHTINVDLALRVLFHATKETVYPLLKNNSHLPTVISSLLGDNSDIFALEDLSRFLSQIRSLPPHPRSRFLRRLNSLTLESTKVAEIKFWAVYFLLVDYIKLHHIEHVPLDQDKKQGTYVGDALFVEYGKARQSDQNSIAHLKLKNEVKYEMMNIVQLVLETLKGLNENDNHVELINVVLYGTFYCGRMDYVALRTALKKHSSLELDKKDEQHNLTMKPVQNRLKRINKLADVYREMHQKTNKNTTKKRAASTDDEFDQQFIFKKPLRKKFK